MTSAHYIRDVLRMQRSDRALAKATTKGTFSLDELFFTSIVTLFSNNVN